MEIKEIVRILKEIRYEEYEGSTGKEEQALTEAIEILEKGGNCAK